MDDDEFTDESRMQGECKNHKIYGRILIENCRNIQDPLSAFIYPIFAGAYNLFQEIDFIDSLEVSMPPYTLTDIFILTYTVYLLKLPPNYHDI
jgi:hypothetical protein